MLFPFRFHLKQMHSKSISRPHFARSYALKDNIALFGFIRKLRTLSELKNRRNNQTRY